MTSRVRTRASGLASMTRDTETYVYTSGCAKSTTPVSWSRNVTEGSERIVDVVTPQYGERIENGEVINNPCNYLKDGAYTSTSGRLVAQRKEFYCGNKFRDKRLVTGDIAYDLWYNYGASVYPSISRTAFADEASAKLRALSEIDSTPYGFMEDVFEIRETLRFLRRPATSLKKLAQDTWRRRNAAVPLGAQAVADVYLAARFAATPLILSLQSGSEAIDKTIRSAERPKRRTARGFSKTSHTESTGPVELTQYQSYFLPTVEGFAERSQSISAGILYEVSNPVVDYPFFLGLRAKDVPEAVWAVVPWSFMIDRALNISQAIRGLTNLSDPSVNILAAWCTTRTEDKFGTRMISARSVNPTSYPLTEFAPSEWSKTRFEYDRQVWIPSIVDALPPLDLKGLVSDATKIADALALAVQFFNLTSQARR